MTWASALVVFLAFAGAAQAQVVSAPTDTVKGRAPEIESVTISGTGSGAGGAYVVGDELTVTYVQSDPDSDPADKTATDATIQWYSGADPVGTRGSTTYTIADTDLGKVITVRLQPHTDEDTTDPYQGGVADSSDISPSEGGGFVSIGTGTTATAVVIMGDAEVGETLTAVPSCATTCDAGITYQWQIETGVGSDAYEDIANATSATYTVLRTEQKRRLRVEATNP